MYQFLIFLCVYLFLDNKDVKKKKKTILCKKWKAKRVKRVNSIILQPVKYPITRKDKDDPGDEDDGRRETERTHGKRKETWNSAQA